MQKSKGLFRSEGLFSQPEFSESPFSQRVGPTVGSLIKSDSFQTQVVSVGVAIASVEQIKSNPGQVFGRRHCGQNDGLVVGDCLEKLANRPVVLVHQKCVVPSINDMLFCQRLDLGEVHDHAIGSVMGPCDDVARERYLNRVTMPMQMAALAFVVGNSVPGIEFQAAGNFHGDFLGRFVIVGANSTIRGLDHRGWRAQWRLGC